MKRVLLAMSGIVPALRGATMSFAVMLASHAALSAQAGSRALVEVVAIGAPALRAAMAERIGSLEARFPIAVRWSSVAAIDVREIVAPRPEGEAVLARIWLDMSSPQRAVLLIANSNHDRLLVRVVPAGDAYGEVTRESLATIVESAIDALLAGGQIGIDRGAAVREIEALTGTAIAAEPQASAVPIAERAPALRSPRRAPALLQTRPWLLAGQYRVNAVAAGPSLRHAAQFALSHASGDLDRAVRLLLMITAHYAPGFSLGEVGRRVQQHGGGVRVAAGATSRLARTFVWRAALGVGADLFRVEPAIAADSGLQAAAPFFVTTPIATLCVSGSIRPVVWLDIALGVGLDLALVSPHFDLAIGSARTTLIEPWRAHPYALVGVGVPFDVGSAR